MTDTVEYIQIPVYDPRAKIPPDSEKVGLLANIIESELRLYSKRWDMSPADLSAVLAVVKSRTGIKSPLKGLDFLKAVGR